MSDKFCNVDNYSIQFSSHKLRTACILAEMTLAACLADGLVMYCSASTSLSSVSLSIAMGRGPTPALHSIR